MSIKRNDPCPCGSGRKYKACCLKKQDLMEFRQLQADRFFDLKHSLTVKMLDFLHSHVPAQERLTANRIFNETHQLPSSSNLKDYYSKFWLCYFYSFSNGLRGVEWFAQQGKQLSVSEQELLAVWVHMAPRLLQVTGVKSDGISVTDLITQETFFLPFCETLKQVWPWGVALALIEPFGEHYCIHGISSFEPPAYADKLTDMILSKMKATGQPYPDVMQQNFLELVQHTFSPAGREEKAVVEEETTLLYQVLDFKRALLFLQEHQAGFYLNHFENKKAQFSWTGPWYEYSDNAFPGIIQVSEELASIDLAEQQLTFKTTDPDKLKEFISHADRVPSILRLTEQTQKAITTPNDMRLKTTNVRYEHEDTPPWFTLYAQQLMNMKIKLDTDSIIHEPEAWTREVEYAMMKLMTGNYPSFDQPFSVNPLLQELGLSPSPFVSEDRACSIRMVQVESRQIEVILDDDVPNYQQLGLTSQTAFSFYAKDLVEFFKIKTTEKSASTVKKYEWGIEKLIHYFLSFDQEGPEDWNQCDHAFWENLITGFYIRDSYQSSLSQAQAFISVIKQLAAWLDKKYATKHALLVKEILNASEEELLAGVKAFNASLSLHTRRSSVNLTPVVNAVQVMAGSYQKVYEGYFEVVSVPANWVRLRQINEDDYIAASGLKAQHLLQKGMIVHGILGQMNGNKGEIIELKSIYPSRARQFLGYAEELVLTK